MEELASNTLDELTDAIEYISWLFVQRLQHAKWEIANMSINLSKCDSIKHKWYFAEYNQHFICPVQKVFGEFQANVLRRSFEKWLLTFAQNKAERNQKTLFTRQSALFALKLESSTQM